MVHFLLRIAVWVVVLGIGYLVIGPDLFDSSSSVSPFEQKSKIFLPPAKSQRHLEFEQVSKGRRLNAEELAAYRVLVQERESNFWQQEGVSVEAALSGVQRQRKERLAALLEQRGMTNEEVAVFLLVIERDQPALLEDRD